jgi:hypothetical protein
MSKTDGMATSDMLLQFVLSGLMVGSIYALIALGFNILSTGSVVLEGRAQDFLEGEAVRKAYLG